MENNPQVVFERLFGDGSTDAGRRARRQQSRSLLDSVTGEVSSLQKALPASDRSRLDQYLSDVREIERRIQKSEQQVTADLKVPAAPVGLLPLQPTSTSRPAEMARVSRARWTVTANSGKWEKWGNEG